MPSRLNPYISFKDNARQAMEFYHSVFGGQLHMTTFDEFHATENPADAKKIMHATLEGDNDILFMAADTPEGVPTDEGANISMSLSGEDEALLRGYWEKLSNGAMITLPLEKAPWGDTFGMLTDKFGVNWMVNITGDQGG